MQGFFARGAEIVPSGRVGECEARGGVEEGSVVCQAVEGVVGYVWVGEEGAFVGEDGGDEGLGVGEDAGGVEVGGESALGW